MCQQNPGETVRIVPGAEEAHRKVIFVLSTGKSNSKMEQTSDEIDEMFSNLLGEMDMLTQSLEVETFQLSSPKESTKEFNFSVGFKDLNGLVTMEQQEAQAKTDKIKLALEKLKEAKVKKLVVKVHMNDNSTKSLMVDERQVARDVLDNLFEKTHCDCKVDWCLYEVYPELQIERFFEDHENVVEVLSDWTRDSENKMLFLEKNEKYAVFKNPQNFYLANKGKNESKEMNEKNKEALLEESFCGASVIVPELEAALYLKEDGKKSWKRRYFLLRASGIYYVPKGKTKTSRDLACFIQFENVNIYYGTQYRVKYKAPTDHCFVLKHPQIQKESQYIKYLCCDDQWTLHQWVTGIRIAKYGKTLYDNYKRAVQRAGLAARWTSLGIVEPAVSTGSSSTGAAQANGQIHHASKEFSEAPKQAEIAKEKRPNVVNNSSSAQPVIRPQKPEAKQALQPPPPPQRRSSATVSSPCLPSKAKRGSTASLSDPISFPAPPPDMGSDLPPPPPDFYEPPPDFVPPPPPSFSNSTGDLAPPLPPPPPPPPASVTSKPLPLTRKPGPPAPKRQENTGQVGETKSTGVEGGQLDFMSDLRKALNKKRGDNTS
ncbi:amyloid beta A4 precursor protein-binding family B member 1-interacting protein isoform A [Alligator mississippiensis]|uniref:Amyloid beta A4 precursor protein-binding family B member 1-interacting protein n=1 Tax=Alligator mississippiensis TaxID=8496 RepID=A0A151PCI1_ALLMI|nr:amyloid beta A4 precursor protein-binding family B member 1-interacting protein isoform A [Alligator mississippiensis]